MFFLQVGEIELNHGGWTPTKVTENGRPELACHLSCEWQHRSGQRAWAPSHNQRDWSSFRCWTSYRTELLGQSQWIFPFIYFFLGFSARRFGARQQRCINSGSKFNGSFPAFLGSSFILRQSNFPEEQGLFLGLQQQNGGSFQFSSWVFSEPRIILCASCRVLPGELGA